MTSILSRWKWVINKISSNETFLKTKNIFANFFYISEIYIKLWTFKKKMGLIADVYQKL